MNERNHTEHTKQVILIILDGWGYREETEHNAVAQAKTPNFDRLWNTYPHALLEASGLAVGLPEGQMGNSEVGHTTIGAGKPLDQDLVRIQKAIDNGEFGENPAITTLFTHVQKHESTLHVLGLLSDGGVHSHMEHLFAFLRTAQEKGITKVAVHVFTDGRDTPPQSASGYMKELEKVITDTGVGFIASVSGRFYAMDRDNNWDRLDKTIEVLFENKGHMCTTSPSKYIENLYAQVDGKGGLDEHIEPMVCEIDGKTSKIETNDGIFFFNFRADRARMLSKKILERVELHNLTFATLTEYDSQYGAHVAFPKIQIETTIAKEVSLAGFTQAHIAETEKFPHATYFLNGGVETLYDGEEHVLLDSRKDVPTHDLAPKMRAEGIADAAIMQIEKGTNFIFINFANPDMVGHTANVPAIIEAIEETDAQLGRVVEAAEKQGAVVFFTADHGNAETNIDPITEDRHTSHTINPVPAVITDTKLSIHNGTLADIAPTILEILGIAKPVSMTGTSLIDR